MTDVKELSDEDIRRLLGIKTAAASAEAVGGPLSWGDVPFEALANTPQSAMDFAVNTIHPFIHPIETAQSFFELGRGLLSKAGIMEADETSVDAVAQFFKDRYGGLDNLKDTLATDPVGVLADLSIVLSPTRATSIPGRVSRAANPVNIAAKTAGGVGKGASVVLAATTGVGPRAIQEAYRSGREGIPSFVEHLRGRGDINEPVEMARRGVRDLADERRSAYRAGMGGVDMAATVDLNPIGTAIINAENKIYLNGVAKSDDAAKILADIKAKMREYGPMKPTVEVMDHMKQAIGEIREKTQFRTLERGIADDIYNAIKDEIVRQAPEYADVMKGYEQASKNINEVTKTLSLGEKGTKDTAGRKLYSVMRNNVNTNYGARTKLADALAQSQPDLMPSIAGQALSSPIPRGIQGALAGSSLSSLAGAGAYFLSPWVLAGLPLGSPRLVGEASRYAGMVGRVASPLMKGSPSAQQVGRVANEVPPPFAAAASAEPEDAQPRTPESLTDDEIRRLLGID